MGIHEPVERIILTFGYFVCAIWIRLQGLPLFPFNLTNPNEQMFMN